MTAEPDLLPLPWIERYAVVGDIAYPVSSDPDGDYVAHDDHTAAMQAYARANVAHATAAKDAEIEALRAEVSGLRAARIAYANEFPPTEDGEPDTGNIHANIRAKAARAERLAEALREYGLPLTGDDKRDAWEFGYEAVAREKRRRAALEQEEGRG